VRETFVKWLENAAGLRLWFGTGGIVRGGRVRRVALENLAQKRLRVPRGRSPEVRPRLCRGARCLCQDFIVKRRGICFMRN